MNKYKSYGKGWHLESIRHSLAAKGIGTKGRRFSMALTEYTSEYIYEQERLRREKKMARLMEEYEERLAELKRLEQQYDENKDPLKVPFVATLSDKLKPDEVAKLVNKIERAKKELRAWEGEKANKEGFLKEYVAEQEPELLEKERGKQIIFYKPSLKEKAIVIGKKIPIVRERIREAKWEIPIEERERKKEIIKRAPELELSSRLKW